MKKKLIIIISTIITLPIITLTTMFLLQKKYTVTFNTNGGTTIPSQIEEENGKATQPTNSSKTGYTFKGWYMGSNEYNFNNKITNNITLTAKWEEEINFTLSDAKKLMEKYKKETCENYYIRDLSNVVDILRN